MSFLIVLGKISWKNFIYLMRTHMMVLYRPSLQCKFYLLNGLSHLSGFLLWYVFNLSGEVCMLFEKACADGRIFVFRSRENGCCTRNDCTDISLEWCAGSSSLFVIAFSSKLFPKSQLFTFSLQSAFLSYEGFLHKSWQLAMSILVLYITRTTDIDNLF